MKNWFKRFKKKEKKIQKPIIVFFNIIQLEKHFIVIDYYHNKKYIKMKVGKENGRKKKQK